MAAFRVAVSLLNSALLRSEQALARDRIMKILIKEYQTAFAPRSCIHINSTPKQNQPYCPFTRYHSQDVRNKLFKTSKQGENLKSFATLASTEKEMLKRNLRYPNVLIKIEGFDEAILDSYCQFINSTSTMLGLEVTKQFNLPTKQLTYKIANPPDSYRKRKAVYNLKNHGRMIQVKELPVEQADIFLEHIQVNSPEGVKMQIETKTWQDYVAPPDPRLVEQRRQEFERRKAIEMERRRQKLGG